MTYARTVFHDFQNKIPNVCTVVTYQGDTPEYCTEIIGGEFNGRLIESDSLQEALDHHVQQVRAIQFRLFTLKKEAL